MAREQAVFIVNTCPSDNFCIDLALYFCWWSSVCTSVNLQRCSLSEHCATVLWDFLPELVVSTVTCRKKRQRNHAEIIKCLFQELIMKVKLPNFRLFFLQQFLPLMEPSGNNPWPQKSSPGSQNPRLPSVCVKSLNTDSSNYLSGKRQIQFYLDYSKLAIAIGRTKRNIFSRAEIPIQCFLIIPKFKFQEPWCNIPGWRTKRQDAGWVNAADSAPLHTKTRGRFPSPLCFAAECNYDTHAVTLLLRSRFSPPRHCQTQCNK